jgi:hypothetical protein
MITSVDGYETLPRERFLRLTLPMSILELNNICVKIGLTKTEVNHMKQIIIVYYDGEKKVKEIRTIGK